jgi:hypothetical protein
MPPCTLVRAPDGLEVEARTGNGFTDDEGHPAVGVV